MVVIRVNPDFEGVFRSAEARRINYDEIFHVLLAHYEDKTSQVQTLRNLVNEWFVDNTLGKENKLWGLVHDSELWLSLSEIENYFGLSQERAQEVIRSGGLEFTQDEDDNRVKIYEINKPVYAKLEEAGGFNQFSRIGKFVNIPVPFETTFRTGISKRVASILKDAKQGRLSLDETLEFLQYTYDKGTDAEVAAVRKETKRWLDQNTQVKYRRLLSMVDGRLWLTHEEVQTYFRVDNKTARIFLDENQAIVDEYPETPVTYYLIDAKKYEGLSAYRNKKQPEPAPSSSEAILHPTPKIKRGRPKSQIKPAEISPPDKGSELGVKKPESLAEIVEHVGDIPPKVIALPVRYPAGVVETAEGLDITALFETMPPQLRELVLHKDYVARGENEKVIVETDCFGEFTSFYKAQTDLAEKAAIAERRRRNAEKPGILVEPKTSEPVKNLMDKKGLEAYVSAQVKSVQGLPAEKVGNISSIATRFVLQEIKGKFSVQYDPEKVEAATADFISKLELGFGRASPKLNGAYTDYNEMYPARFKSLGEAMEFASAWLREQGVDGDRFVYAARTSKISEIVRSAKANGKVEYARDLIILRLKRNFGNVTSNKELITESQPKKRRGRRKKDRYDEIPLEDLVPSDEEGDSRDLDTFLMEERGKD